MQEGDRPDRRARDLSVTDYGSSLEAGALDRTIEGYRYKIIEEFISRAAPRSSQEMYGLAVLEALDGAKVGNFPVGAILVLRQKVGDQVVAHIFGGRNTVESSNFSTRHAEINVLEDAIRASKNMGTYPEEAPKGLLMTRIEPPGTSLTGSIYVTLEPCSGCLRPLLHAASRLGITELNFAVPDREGGAVLTDEERIELGWGKGINPNNPQKRLPPYFEKKLKKSEMTVRTPHWNAQMPKTALFDGNEVNPDFFRFFYHTLIGESSDLRRLMKKVHQAEPLRPVLRNFPDLPLDYIDPSIRDAFK